ncbi:hypothetical protein OTU49_007359, partial [Cherax quadricarinatus]
TPATCIFKSYTTTTHMKDYQVVVIVVGVLLLAMMGKAARQPVPDLHLPYTVQARHDHSIKRGFWDKRAALSQTQDDTEEDYPLQALWQKQEVSDKRGFGSMMPAYLVHLYRTEQPLLDPSVIFTPSRRTTDSDRSKIDYNSQG